MTLFVNAPLCVLEFGQVLLSSHLGRPKSGPEDKFSLTPVSERLTKLLGKKVTMAPDCIGSEVGCTADGVKDFWKIPRKVLIEARGWLIGETNLRRGVLGESLLGDPY